MKSKLFPEVARKMQTCAGRWLRVTPEAGVGYLLYDLLAERSVGRILVNGQGHWIYDAEVLSVAEQEDVAGQLLGHQTEMDQLFSQLSQSLI